MGKLEEISRLYGVESGSPYRHLASDHGMALTLSSDYYDLAHQAYQVRRSSKVRRQVFADRLVTKLMNGAKWDESRVHEAEALHLVSVPLAGEVPPLELVQLLAPPIERLKDMRRENQELWRYSGLLIRTVSMAASKLDRYTAAYHFINQAHGALATSTEDQDNMTKAEAIQQLLLQECGQLTRNVEAGLVEHDKVRRKVNWDGNPPERSLQIEEELVPMRVLARAAAESGRQGCLRIERIIERCGLPDEPDPEDRRLAASSWFLTSNIMYLRSLMSAATVELLARNQDSTYSTEAQRVYASIIEWTRTPLQQSHKLDLTRAALHWAFLNDGNHPYLQRPLLVPIRKDVPRYLAFSVDGKLDVDKCSAELFAHDHNAGVLDNIAHAQTYQILSERGGVGRLGYLSWLDRRRRMVKSQVTDDDIEEQVRSSKTTTTVMLSNAARMVVRSGRYRYVLQGL
ncbi:hypothetical protein [Rhodococcus sp. KRD162]|uniref:hypothetical protein n=1 Tax=Rhodococcus sp. KRD162 TaxID=2729725 RepID=UPI0019D1C414|nr:hypothetical protein [Rhodococcus sp. KRD162]